MPCEFVVLWPPSRYTPSKGSEVWLPLSVGVYFLSGDVDCQWGKSFMIRKHADMSTPQQARWSVSEALYQMNNERGLVGNILGLFCAACMLGLGNMLANSFLKVDMGWLLKVLLVCEIAYFFIPYLILKIILRQPISRS